ncbi:MAG: hypothetical protein R3D68_02530 [Hyphomicrobiaceae bacterium]
MTTRIARWSAALCTLVAFSQPVAAQDLSANISCLTGRVAANDWANLAQRVSESYWDHKGGVSLTSSLGNVQLRVLDPYDQSVCDDTANNTTSCTFRTDLNSIPYFNIIVDNQKNAEGISYKICAY